MQQQEQEVTITLGDLSTLLQLIDVVSQRGAIQGQELAGVGMLRNKLEAYLRQNSPQQDNPGDQPANVEVPPEGPLADKLV